MTHHSPLLSCVHPDSVPVPDHAVAFQQLRHQTKNALQRILCQIAQSRELQATRQGQRLLDDLERRVRLSAAVSDALFGLTEAPGSLKSRMERLAQATVDLLGDADQFVRLEIQAEAPCPVAAEGTVLRILHELVANAVTHGLYSRSAGQITVRLAPEARGGVRLLVMDDGWGFPCPPEHGEGLSLALSLAASHGGTLTLERRNGATVATVMLRG